MAINRICTAEAATTTTAPANANAHFGTIEIDQNHHLYLQPNDTPGSSLISIQLTSFKNYSLWSRSMVLSLVGKNKVGFIDGRYPKNYFYESLHDQWERVNIVVLS